MKGHRRIGVAVAALTAAGTLGLSAQPALAVSAGESVSGTTAGTLSLTAGTGAIFATGFSPGNTASQSGALTATDTNPSWTLQVQDNGTGAGHMVASTSTTSSASTCYLSDAQLANATHVDVSSPLGGVTSAGSVAISGTAATVASATNQLLAANVLTTSYSVVIPSSEVMLAGCVYTQTATYTLQ
jgi:hypothetical protein